MKLQGATEHKASHLIFNVITLYSLLALFRQIYGQVG